MEAFQESLAIQKEQVTIAMDSHRWHAAHSGTKPHVHISRSPRRHLREVPLRSIHASQAVAALHDHKVALPSLPVRMLVGRGEDESKQRYRLFLAQIHLHLSSGGGRVGHRRLHRRFVHLSSPLASSDLLLIWPMARCAREQVCGIVQYTPMRTARRGGGGSEECDEHGRGKRKARLALEGIVTQHDLDAWLKDVGGDDVMLEELLSVESADGWDVGGDRP